jgi:hypothetical protein
MSISGVCVFEKLAIVGLGAKNGNFRTSTNLVNDSFAWALGMAFGHGIWAKIWYGNG